MKIEKHIGQKIACLARQVDRAIGRETSQYGISSIQGKIIGFVYYKTKKCKTDIFQKDIEESFGIRRSSVSSVLDKLESSKYIVRKNCEKDARLKKIELTKEGEKVHKNIHASIAKVEDILDDSLSEAELNFFIDIVDRLSSKIES